MCWIMLHCGSSQSTVVMAERIAVTAGFITLSAHRKRQIPEDAGGLLIPLWHQLEVANTTGWSQSLLNSAFHPAEERCITPQAMRLQKIISPNIPVLLLSLPQQFCVHLRRRTEPAPAVSQPTAILSTKITHSRLSASWRTAFPSSMASTIPVTNLSNAEGVFLSSKTALRSSTVPVRSGSKALPLCWIVLKRTTESTSLTAMAVLTLKGWISSIPGSQHGPHFSFVPDRTGHMMVPVSVTS